MEEKISVVLNTMVEFLDAAQMKKLQGILVKTFSENEPERSNNFQ